MDDAGGTVRAVRMSPGSEEINGRHSLRNPRHPGYIRRASRRRLHSRASTQMMASVQAEGES
jgi:chloramphenicol 3-O-phosphotransferase